MNQFHVHNWNNFTFISCTWRGLRNQWYIYKYQTWFKRERKMIISIIFNWSLLSQIEATKLGIHKIMALVNVKHEKHLKTLDIAKSRDQFESTMVKWKKTSTIMMAIIYSHHYKYNHACKDKWTIIFGDYCMIKEYTYTTNINED